MNRIISTLFWLLVLGGFLNYVISSNYPGAEDIIKLRRAYEDYVAGERAKDNAKRMRAFNKSLAIYAELEKRYEPKAGNGNLYYNLANNYFQLGAYPEAIFYYKIALALRPGDVQVLGNLNIALDKLKLAPEKADLFAFSIPERLRLFALCSLASLTFFSLYIWTGRMIWRKLSFLLFLFVAIVAVNLGYRHYFGTVEAVLVKSSPIYRGAGFEYARIAEEPLRAGETVKVLRVARQGKWLQVVTGEGGIGYISCEVAKIISFD